MERVLNKGYISMCTHVSRCRTARHDRALPQRGQICGTHNKHGKFCGEPQICMANFAVTLRHESSHAKSPPPRNPPPPRAPVHHTHNADNANHAHHTYTTETTKATHHALVSLIVYFGLIPSCFLIFFYLAFMPPVLFSFLCSNSTIFLLAKTVLESNKNVHAG